MKKNRFLRLLPVSLLIIILISLTSLGIYAEGGAAVTEPEIGILTVPLIVHDYGITDDLLNDDLLVYEIINDSNTVTNGMSIDPTKNLEIRITNYAKSGHDFRISVNVYCSNVYYSVGDSGFLDSGDIFNKSYNPAEIVSTQGEKYSSITQITIDLVFDGIEITLNSNFASDTDQQIIPKNGSMPLKSCPFTRDGYIFSGWNTKANGSGTAFDDRGIITYSSTEFENPSKPTLYAQWKKAYTNISEAAAELRTKLINRENPIHIDFQTTNSDHNAIIDSIWNTAVAHDKNTPNGGDYIMQHMKGYQTGTTISYDGTTYTFGITWDNIEYYTTAAQEEQLTQSISTVLGSLNLLNKTDYEKFNAIYEYIISNVVYDQANLNDESYKLKFTAYAAMINKTAVCQGYANLLYRMLLQAGVDCRIITGWGYGGEKEGKDIPAVTDDEATNIANKWERHAWNIVKLGDKYYNVDATWDASGVKIVDEGGNILGFDKSYSYLLRGNNDTLFPKHSKEAPDLDNSYVLSDADYLTVSVKIGHSLSLGGSIGVIFNLHDENGIVIDWDSVSCSINNESISPVIDQSNKTVTCYINPLQMADMINLSFIYTYGGSTYNYSGEYSAENYIRYYQNNSTVKNSNLYRLVYALGDYGYYCQHFLAKYHNLPLTGGNNYDEMTNQHTTYTVADITSVKASVSGFAPSVDIGTSDITNINYSLNLDDSTSINLYFEKSGDTPTVTMGGTTLTPVNIRGSLWKVSIPGIMAHQLGNNYTVDINGAKITVSALTYVYLVLKDYSSGNPTDIINAAVSIYKYYDAARIYIGQ